MRIVNFFYLDLTEVYNASIEKISHTYMQIEHFILANFGWKIFYHGLSGAILKGKLIVMASYWPVV